MAIHGKIIGIEWEIMGIPWENIGKFTRCHGNSRGI
jgi:hypothetical protein